MKSQLGAADGWSFPWEGEREVEHPAVGLPEEFLALHVQASSLPSLAAGSGPAVCETLT